jgi:alkylation response protein AidB-like acyl-CoA dehydrogenase
MGQIEAQIETMLQICKAAAREIDAVLAGPDARRQAFTKGVLKPVIVAKMMCGQLGWQVVSTVSEMFGSLGYTEPHLINKLVRDMRYISIVEAGDDVCRALMYQRFVPK